MLTYNIYYRVVIIIIIIIMKRWSKKLFV